MLIVDGWAWANRFLAQTRIEGVQVQLSEFVEQRLGPGLGCQNAADGGQGEGAEAEGTLEGGEHIVTLVMRQQRQELLGLQLALDLLLEQAIEELHRDGTEFLEALPQQSGPLLRIVGGMMSLDDGPSAGHGRGQQYVPGKLIQGGRVDEDLAV